METIVEEPAATVTIDGVATLASDGTITLDESWAPYGQGRLVVPLTSASEAEAIDPRDNIRVVIEAENTSTDASTDRTFNLSIRSREVDHAEMTVALEVATDEALLQDYAPLADDTTPRGLEASLRDVIDYALDLAIPGASLNASPSDDADVTRYWTVTNLIPNPKFATNTTGWGTGLGASAFGWVNFGGNGAGGWTAAAGTSNVIAGTTVDAYRVTPGEWYVFALGIRSSVSRLARAAINWRTGGGLTAHATVYGAAVATITTDFTRVYVIAQAPDGADHAQPFVNTEGNSAGNLHYIDNAMFYQGRELVPYFDGATTDTAQYSYAWSDATLPDATSSIRTPLIEGPGQDALTWPAGVSAWDFLQPLVTASAKRLFCDEARVWRLVPADYIVAGVVTVAERYNATQGTDLITRGDRSLWANGVVVIYEWTGANGGRFMAIDSAGTPGLVRTVRYERPYAGPGAAAYILSVMQGQGRTQDVVALTNYDATPGMEVSITLPGAFDQIGRLKDVVFNVTTGLMRVGSRGLTSTPPEAWAMLDVGESWSDSPIGGTWTGETI